MAPKRKRPSGGGSASTKGVFNVWGKCTAENYLSLIFFFFWLLVLTHGFFLVFLRLVYRRAVKT
jgi:hypothetical protein